VPQVKVPEILSKEEIQRLPTYEREFYIKEAIRKTLQLNAQGVTMGDLVKALGFESRTVDKYLSIMKHTNEIYVDNYGNTVVYFPNTRMMHAISEETFPLSNDLIVKAFRLRNNLGEFVFVQSRQKDEYREDVNSGLLIPLDRFPDFVEYMKRMQTEMLRIGVGKS
jgi:hypothetical protein